MFKPSTRAKSVEVEPPVIEEEFNNNAPLMDDDYGFMPPDHVEKHSIMEEVDQENQVPEVQNQNEVLQSPMKRLSISQQSTSSFSRSTLDTLQIWKLEFTKKKTLDLADDLMVAMVDPDASVTKKTAAAAFFEALVLRGKGLVSVKQDAPFAPI